MYSYLQEKIYFSDWQAGLRKSPKGFGRFREGTVQHVAEKCRRHLQERKPMVNPITQFVKNVI